MDYKSTVITIGPLVEEMAAEGNFIIVFNENAPESLAEMSVLHTICDMDQEIKDYYEKYYNAELTDEDLQEIYNPARAAAGK